MAQLSVGQVMQLAQKGDENTRLNAVKALFSLATPEAGQALRMLARDQADAVRRLAVQAYQQLEQKLGGPGSIPAGPPGGAPAGGASVAAAAAAAAAQSAPAAPPAGGGGGLAGLVGGGATSAAARQVQVAQATGAAPPAPAAAAAPPAGGGGGLAGLVGGGATSAAARQVEQPPPAAAQPAPAAPPAGGGGGLAGLVGGGGTSAAARQVEAAQAAPQPAATPAPQAAPMAAAQATPQPSPMSAAPGGAGSPALQNFQRAVQGYMDMRGRLEQAWESLERLRDSAMAQGVPEAQLPMPPGPGGGGDAAAPTEGDAGAPRLDQAQRQVLMAASQAAARAQRPNPGNIQEAEVPALRRAAAALLAPCLERSLEGLREERSELAQTHARVLGLLAPPDAFNALAGCIQEQIMEPAFFEALGLLGDPRGMALLADVYSQDRFAGVKQFIVHAVARIPGAEADQFLVRVLDDPDPSIRNAVVNHIAACGRTQLLGSVMQGLGQRGDNVDVAIAKAAVALAPKDPNIVQALQGRLANADVESRLGKTLITCLGKTGAPDALGFLQPYTKSRDKRLKQLAIDAVCELEIPVDQKLKLLAPALREVNLKGERDPKGRAQAAVKTAQLGGGNAREAVDEMIRSQDGEDRAWAAWALGEMDHEQAVGLLRQAIGDRDLNVRINAIKALGQKADPSAVPVIVGATKDKSDEVRAAAAETLARLGPQAHAAAADLLESEYRPSVLAPTLRALGATDPSPPTSWVKLKEYIVNDEAMVRLAATEAAGKIMCDEAVPDMLERLSDDEHKVRRAAACSLWSYGDVRLVPRVLDLFASEDDEVRLGGAMIMLGLGELQRDIQEAENVGRLVAALRAQPAYQGGA